MIEAHISSLSVDGLTSPVIEAGPAGADEAVVFVHGSPGAAGEFTRLVSEVGKFARAVAVDMPGFGQAAKPHPRDFIYDVPNMGVHLAAVVSELGIERVHWVGHDFGGAWATFAAIYEPQKTASMTMLNSGMIRGMRWHPLARIYRTPLLGELLMAAANRPGMARALSELPRQEVDTIWKNFDRATRRAVLALYRATDIEAQIAQLPMLRQLAAEWPALVIFGEDDKFMPAGLAQRNKEAYIRAEVELIPGVGHWPHLQSPDTVSALLLPFLRRQLAG